MKLLSAAALAALSLVSASPIARDVPEGVLAIPVTRQHIDASNDPRIGRRDTSGTVPEPLQNNVAQYVASFSLGTPGQSGEAILDTGSSDLWVFNGDTGDAGSFKPGSSSTYQLVEKNGFSITYVSGSATGDWGTDTITLGGATIDNFQFATVDGSGASNVGSLGVFGIAPIQGEAASTTYDNFPTRLKDSGYISKVAYSLYLDDINASTGTILFGGYDSAKYSGELKTVPFTSTDSFAVDFSVAGQDNNGVLDSGTSLTYLPEDTFNAIASQQGWDLQYNDDLGYYYITATPTGDGLTYSFGSVDITVPINELFFLQEGDSNYYLTILTNDISHGYTLLGDSFLRSAYVVYDLDDNIAALAQANYNSNSNIVAINGDGIPGTSSA